MIDFDKITFKKPFFSGQGKEIQKILGLDSETLTDGAPFMFCLSDGSTFTLDDLPQVLFDSPENIRNYACWNLKFDSGSLLQKLPPEKKDSLRIWGDVEYNGYKYKYIPHKYLNIKYGKVTVHIWDLMQYFNSSLDNAAWKYLQRRKLQIETKTFTPAYVKKNHNKIRRYCIRDAVLVSELYQYLKAGLNEMKIKPSKLYSVAYLAQQYVKQESHIVSLWRFWKRYNDLVKFAYAAYSGGKFEIYKRGTFNGYLYDINSAYSSELAGLYDIKLAKVEHSVIPVKEASYGFLKVVIDNGDGKPLPMPYMEKSLCTYPAGTFPAYITLNEYLYLLKIKVKVQVLDGWYLIINQKRTQWKTLYNNLYLEKQKAKGKDDRKYNICKLLGNGYYGKLIQRIEQPDGTYKAGISFNPIYAATITANIRVKMTALTALLGESCLAVHTDSVLSLKPLPEAFLSPKMGDLELKAYGSGVLINCGIYEISGHNATRGVYVDKSFSWSEYLKTQGKKQIVQIPQVITRSWYYANKLNDNSLTNVFTDGEKSLDLNHEKKRIWHEKINAQKLLNGCYESFPRFVSKLCF